MGKVQIQEYKVTNLPLSKIKLDDTNPNIVPKETMEAIRKIMKKYGYLDPIIVDKNHVMVDGEHRFKIYKEFGKTEIPTIIATKCDTVTDRKMLRQYLNKVRGRHDKKKDAFEFKAIFEQGKLDEFTAILGTPIEDIQRQLEKEFDLTFVKPEQEIPSVPKNPKTKLGDIYQLGKHRILCGDCTIKENIDKLFQSKTVDQLVTDPPYGVDYTKSKEDYLSRLRNSKNTHKGVRVKIDVLNDALEDYKQFFKSFLQIIPFSSYNTFHIFMSGQQLHALRHAIDESGLTWSDYLVWVKNQFVLGRKDYKARHEFIVYGWKGRHKFYGSNAESTVFEYDKPLVNDLHPTMKPLELVSNLIRDGSKKGMTVCDPFLGSGTTLIACEQSGRTCYGTELDPGYVDVIIARWEKLTGKKAKKL